jgi:hypothetical protein
MADGLSSKRAGESWLRSGIERYLEEGTRDGDAAFDVTVPPGSPIGGCGDWFTPPQPD